MKNQVKKNSKLFLTVAILDVTLQLAEKVFCMLQIILKGIFIGIMVSAPIGPIGILCAQRTLSRGKWHGLITGVGSAVSIFCMPYWCFGVLATFLFCWSGISPKLF